MLSGHQLVSELHGVGSVVLGEAEAGADVLLDDLVLDVGKESSINSLLERLAGFGGLNLRDASSKELLVFFELEALRAKVSSVTPSSLMPLRSTLVLVERVYVCWTRLTGTPFSLNGPVTARRPDLSCFKNTTLFPRNLPASKMSTVPGVIDFLSLDAFGLRHFGVCWTSSLGYHWNFLTM